MLGCRLAHCDGIPLSWNACDFGLCLMPCWHLALICIPFIVPCQYASCWFFDMEECYLQRISCLFLMRTLVKYSHVMYIVKYIRETEIQVFWNMIMSLGKWFPLFWRIVVLLPLGSSSPRIAKLVEMYGVT